MLDADLFIFPLTGNSIKSLEFLLGYCPLLPAHCWGKQSPVRTDHCGVEMFPENLAQVTMSFSWFFHTGWLETGHDCSTKEGDIFGLFIFKKMYSI